MKNKILKLLISTLAASASVYFRKMAVPIAVLAAAMAADYISGTAAAWFEGTLSSKQGKRGAVKKVCYLFLVIAAGLIDWVIAFGFKEIGINLTLSFYFGTVVTIWLIINELLSILENSVRIGLPIPTFLKPLSERLKITVEECVKDE